MANALVQSAPHLQGGGMSVETALRRAWVAWIGMLLFPAVVCVYVIWSVSRGSAPPKSEHSAQVWFVFAMAYMAIAIVGAMFWRSRLFKSYWRGEKVSPGAFLKGSLILWIAIEIGGLLGLIACASTHGLLPNLIPAILAFVLLLIFYPTGRSMTDPVGHHEDPQTYEEPR